MTTHIYTTTGLGRQAADSIYVPKSVDASEYTIATPPIKFVYPDMTDAESSKGAIIEWGGVMDGMSYPYGIATQAYKDNPAATFTAPTGYKKWAWVTAHYDSPLSTGEDVHQHFNIETVQADWLTAVTRLQISFGEDVALVSFPNSNVKFYPDYIVQIGSDANGTYLEHDTAADEITISSPGDTRWNFKDSTLRLYSLVAGGVALESRVASETINRFSMNTSGRMEWGSGAATRDVNLYRNGANQLRTDDVFMLQQAATVSAPPHVVGGIYFDTTLNKLRVGGASGWETVTSV